MPALNNCTFFYFALHLTRSASLGVSLSLLEYDDVRKSVQVEQQVLCGLNLG